jgi:peptide deformylase
MPRLHIAQFGNPVLRAVATHLSPEDIVSPRVRLLIADMQIMLESRRYGIGLAAPQVGHSVAISVIAIKPTPSRPNHQVEELIVINPEIVKAYGRRTQQWEGCISFGTGNFPYAKVPRYKKIRLRYYDEQAVIHERDFDGLLAHVLQHEVDHLNGVLFVDRVRDTTSYMTIQEYKKRYL